jgi:hypothetical protein
VSFTLEIQKQTIAFLLQEHVSIVRRERDLVKDGSKKVCNKVLQLNGKKKGFACSSFSREIPPIYA